jgi:hypothetical protein
VSQRDEVVHKLNDRLNGIAISVELAIRLLAQEPRAAEAREVLHRVAGDCRACADLVKEIP